MTTGMPCGGVSGEQTLASPATSSTPTSAAQLTIELNKVRAELATTQRNLGSFLESVRGAFLAQNAVSRVLHTARTLDEAAEPLLDALVNALEFDVGTLWMLEEGGKKPKLRALAHVRARDDRSFASVCSTMRLPVGGGVAGRVFAESEPLVTELADLNDHPAVALGLPADELGTACAFPIEIDGEPIGVIELLSREPLSPVHAIEPALREIGDRIAAFVERERAEQRFQTLHDALETAAADLEQDAAGLELAEVIPLQRRAA